MLSFTVLNYINVISSVSRRIRSSLQTYCMTDRTFETRLKAKSLYVQWEGYVTSIVRRDDRVAMCNAWHVSYTPPMAPRRHVNGTFMERSWRKTEVFGEKPPPVLLRPLQIPHRLVGFDSRSVICVCDGRSYTGSWERFISEYLGIPLSSVLPLMLYKHILKICHRRYIILVNASVVK